MKLRQLVLLVSLLGTAKASADELPKPARSFLESRCVECHDADTKKGGLDLNAFSTKLDDAPVEAKWIQLFDKVQRGEMPPKKHEQPAAGERQDFLRQLGGYISDHDAARHAKTGRVLWRRLNRLEYENTVHDLLDIDTPLAGMLPEDGSAHGFDNVSEGLRLSSTQIEGYLAAADAALDGAIQLGQAPRGAHYHGAFLDVPAVHDKAYKPTGSLSKEGRIYHKEILPLPDAGVVFINEAYGGTAIRDPYADIAGMYRIRVSAYAYQAIPGQTVVVKVMGEAFPTHHFLGAFDLVPNQPKVFEFTTRLVRGEHLYFSGSGCGLAADGTHVGDVGAEKFTGQGMAIQWVEMEGPLPGAWPPPSVHRVFGDLPIKPLAKPKREKAFEVVSEHPAEEVDSMVTTFVNRAFRRPVSAAETARYLHLAHDALDHGSNLEVALRRAYKAVMVSPEFLFLQEHPGKLDDYALASRLSYFLWSEPPDDALLQSAAAGRLHEPATLREQTERLLRDAKAQAFTKNFCGQWLNLRAIEATQPDRAMYPEFDDLLQHAMVQETESFFNEVLTKNLGVATLIDSNFAMLNRRLAEHYGIAGVTGEEFRRVALPAHSHRGGLLTQASILKVTANGTLSSPVVRGAWVMKRLLGREFPPPPPDAGAIEPDTRGSSTIREQLDKHRRSTSCASCHQYMDPPGFAMENYDVIGGWREEYRTRGQKGKQVIDPLTKQGRQYRLGAPVDASGALADGRTFTNLDELKKLLLEKQEVVARNLVNNLVAYATGAGVTFSDRAKVQAILDEAKGGGYGVRTLVHGLVESPLFLSK